MHYAAMVRVLTDAAKLCGKLSTPPGKVSIACKSIARLKSKVQRLRIVETVHGFEDNHAGLTQSKPK